MLMLVSYYTMISAYYLFCFMCSYCLVFKNCGTNYQIYYIDFTMMTWELKNCMKLVRIFYCVIELFYHALWHIIQHVLCTWLQYFINAYGLIVLVITLLVHLYGKSQAINFTVQAWINVQQQKNMNTSNDVSG